MKKYLFLCLLLSFFAFNSASAELLETSTEDLSVASMTLYPSVPVLNQKCKLVVKVQNSGSKNINTGEGINSKQEDFGGFVVERNTYPSVSYAEPIVPGATVEFVYEGYFASSGTKAMLFTIDNADSVDEKNETNNTKTITANVYGLSESDLIVNKITPSIVSPIVYEKLSIDIEIKNKGRNILTDNKGFMLEDSGTIPSIQKDVASIFPDFEILGFSMDDYPTLDAPMSGVFTLNIEGRFIKPGLKNLSYSVNVNKRLLESNYVNNMATTSLTAYLSAEERDAFRIVNVHPDFKSSSSVEVFWETDKSMGTSLYYRQSISSTFQSISDTSKTKHSTLLSGLVPGAKYYYKIGAVINGVDRETELYDFTMPVKDQILISDLINRIVGTEIKVTWKTSLAADSKLFYRKIGQISYESVSGTGVGISHSLGTGVLSAGDYEYYISSSNLSDSTVRSAVYKATIIAETTENSGEATANTTLNIADKTQKISTIIIKDAKLYASLKGKIILRVEKNGEAYYINPLKQEMYSLGRPDDAFAVMRQMGIGISNANIEKIPVSLKLKPSGTDQDNDGLSDMLEDAIGTDKVKKDSDGDTFTDKAEVEGGFNPLKGSGAKMPIDNNFSISNSGKIFLSTEKHGEAWYINPTDKKRYFLGRPADAFAVMRGLSVGISEINFSKL